MQQFWIILLLLGLAANLFIAWLAFQDGEMGHVATSLVLGALCGGVAYLRIKQRGGSQ